MTTNTTSVGALLALTMVLGACADERNDAEAAANDAAEELRLAMQDFEQDVRGAITEISDDIDELNSDYAGASDEMAEAWDNTKAEIREYRYEMEQGLEKLANATEENAAELEAEVAEDLEAVTMRLERARLTAIRETEDFIGASKERMSELTASLEDVDDDISYETSAAINELKREASELTTRVDLLAESTSEEIAEEREELTEAIASLSASIRKQLFEAEQSLKN